MHFREELLFFPVHMKSSKNAIFSMLFTPFAPARTTFYFIVADDNFFFTIFPVVVRPFVSLALASL